MARDYPAWMDDPSRWPPEDVPGVAPLSPVAPSAVPTASLLSALGLDSGYLDRKKAELGRAFKSDEEKQAEEDHKALLMQYAQSFTNRKFTPVAARKISSAKEKFGAETNIEQRAQDRSAHLFGKNLAANPDNELAPAEWGAPAGMTKKQAIESGFAKKGTVDKFSPPTPEQIGRGNSLGLIPAAGENSEHYEEAIRAGERAAAERAKASEKDKKAGAGDAVKTEIELRREFIGQKGYQDFQTVATAADKVKSASPTGAGDIALVYGFMKLTDPGSTVREGEFATAASAGSADQRAVAWYNKALRGERLPPEVREQFKAEADRILGAQRGRYQRLAEQYRGLAKRYGVDPDRVVFEPGGGGAAAVEAPPVPGAVKTKSGRWAIKNAKGQLEYVE